MEFSKEKQEATSVALNGSILMSFSTSWLAALSFVQCLHWRFLRQFCKSASCWLPIALSAVRLVISLWAILSAGISSEVWHLEAVRWRKRPLKQQGCEQLFFDTNFSCVVSHLLLEITFHFNISSSHSSHYFPQTLAILFITLS